MFRLRPGRQQPPAVWRANLAPRGAPFRCGRRSPECASSSHSTACVGSAAPSSPPQTRRRERPANIQTDVGSLLIYRNPPWNGASLFPSVLIIIIIIIISVPVCWQRWATGRLSAPSPSVVWPARCEPPWVCPCGSCRSRTPPLHKIWEEESSFHFDHPALEIFEHSNMMLHNHQIMQNQKKKNHMIQILD